MPNFALIKPEGGRRRSINDYIQENNQQRSADMQMQNQQMQLDEGVQRQTDRAALRDIVQRSGGNWDQAANEAAAAGVSPDAVMALQDRAQKGEDRTYTLEERKRAEADRGRKESVDKLAVAGKLDEMLGQVGDQESYDRYRTGAAEIAKQYGLQFDVPETYDPAYVESKRKTAQELQKVYHILTPKEEAKLGLDSSGTYQVGKDGKIDRMPETKPARRSIMEYADPSSPTGTRIGYADEAIGLPGKGTLSSRGAGGHDPAKIATANTIMERIPGITWEEAYARANATDVSPTKFATDMVKLEVGSMNTGMDPAQLQERFDFWFKNAPGKAPTQPTAPPAGGLPQSAAAQLQEGQVMTFGNGQQWTLQGGKPVRVK